MLPDHEEISSASRAKLASQCMLSIRSKIGPSYLSVGKPETSTAILLKGVPTIIVRVYPVQDSANIAFNQQLHQVKAKLKRAARAGGTNSAKSLGGSHAEGSHCLPKRFAGIEHHQIEYGKDGALAPTISKAWKIQLRLEKLQLNSGPGEYVTVVQIASSGQVYVRCSAFSAAYI